MEELAEGIQLQLPGGCTAAITTLMDLPYLVRPSWMTSSMPCHSVVANCRVVIHASQCHNLCADVSFCRSLGRQSSKQYGQLYGHEQIFAQRSVV
jgi:hypothetical protein